MVCMPSDRRVGDSPARAQNVGVVVGVADKLGRPIKISELA
jgi:hypothetical protein